MEGEEKKNAAKLPKDHYEKDMKNTPCGGGKYSEDNVAELESSTEKLASFVKGKKPSK